MRSKWVALPIALVAVSLLGLVACSKGGGKKASNFNITAELAKVKAARAELVSSREQLASVKSELASLNTKQKLTSEESAHKTELEQKLKTAQTAFDEAFSKDQSTLTEFLNVALNEMPGAPETHEALKLYADQAVYNAKEFMNQAGDYNKAIDLLQTAEGYFEAVNAKAPENLEQTLQHAKDFRFLTKERFDQARNGMTEDQVKAVTGPPFYANIRENEVHGRKITSWLFNREDQQVAAFYFEKGKLYAKKWDVREK